MRNENLLRVGRCITVIVCIICLLFCSMSRDSVWAASETSEVSLIKSDDKEIQWNSEIGNIEIPFSCEAGIYSVVFEYIPSAIEDSDIMTSIKVDGEYPSEEFRTINLPRCWVTETDNYFDSNGNEYAAYLTQKESLLTEPARDKDGMHSENLTVELGKGEHTLELGYLSGTMTIKNIRLVPLEDQIDYKTYASANSDKEYDGEAITIEGEAVISRSGRDIPCYSHNDPTASPNENGKSRINAFGGSYWYKGNSSATWEFDVPEDGMYKISMHIIQNNDGLLSQRQIMIDGKLPFEELEAYSFDYARKLRTVTLGGDEPFLFFFTKGRHTLTMRAVCDIYSDQISEYQDIAQEIYDIVSDIQMVTGSSPDPNFDYELDKKLPEVIERINALPDRIENATDAVDTISGSAPTMTSNLHADAKTIADLVSHVEKIPDNLGTLSTIQGDMQDAAATLQSQPLGIDWIQIQAPSEEPLEPKASFGSRVKYGFSAFINSFKGEDSEKTADTRSIDVWVARDKEWANVMQMLINEEFEPKYGIKVNLNVLPSGNTTVVSGASPLLLSVVADNTPDIALGCDSKTPIELAIRGELCDISAFSDYEEVAENYTDGAMQGLTYDGKVYGLPETTDMPVMVYRTDIMEQNDIAVPETWEQLMQETLPKLTQIDANFYMGSSSPEMYATMLYQMGSDLYDENGDSQLNSPEAVAAFKQWTKCFVQYNVPQSANFYNEMRTGKLPIGICSLAEYMQLKAYATELTGKIQIAPVPGNTTTDGTINHDSTGSMTSAVMFEKAEDKEACWDFMKWWLSEEVQTKFEREVESKVGASGRWMSGNVNAFMNLSWTRQEAEVLKSSIGDFRTFYNVLGGYYTTRSITNAWTRTVFSGMDARSSLEQAYEEVSLQIERKRREYAE